MNRVVRNLFIYLLIVLIAVSVIRITSPVENEVVEWNKRQFSHALEQNKIESVEITPEREIYRIEGVLKDDTEFKLNMTPDPELEDKLAEMGVNVTAHPAPEPPWWANIVWMMLPLLLIVGLIFFLLYQSQGGGSRVMQFGKSRAKMHTPEKVKVNFSDVAGCDETVEELQEVVEFLKDPKKFGEIGAQIPKGVLLYGAPGTGKTLLGRAVAGEAGVPFFSISGSDFVEMFVGVGASRVRDLFKQAKENAPCIIFVDEMDAVGRQRGAGLGGGHDEREQTLNQLLVEMDGFEINEGIIVMAATNRPDILDPALLRPGRFDRQITVDLPDIKGREEILNVHVRKRPLGKDVDLNVIARRTPGFTGADLANLVNEAALLAARRGKRKIEMGELENSIERIIAGPEKKSRVMSEYEKKLVSYHEAGHALAAYYLPNTDPLHKVSIVPRGGAGGYTLLLPEEDKRYLTKSQLLDQITTLLGGRVSEEVVLNEITTGGQNDLERATDLVRKLITEYGMSDELGPLTYGRKQEQQVFLGRDISRDRNYSEAVAFSIDKEARRIIDDSYEKCKKIFEENMDKLHLVAQVLMEKETVEASEFEALMEEIENGKNIEEAKKVINNDKSRESESEEQKEKKESLHKKEAGEDPSPSLSFGSDDNEEDSS